MVHIPGMVRALWSRKDAKYAKDGEETVLYRRRKGIKGEGAIGQLECNCVPLRLGALARGRKYGKVTVAVPPHYTSQNCSNCGETVKKSLSCRTHVCTHCGYVADRDVNAARNILIKGLTTVGHTESNTLGEMRSLAVPTPNPPTPTPSQEGNPGGGYGGGYS